MSEFDKEADMIEKNTFRQLLLEQLDYDEFGFVPGTFGYHEVVDRASIILENFHDYILCHPSVVSSEILFDEAYEIMSKMMSFYQKTASIDDNESDEDDSANDSFINN